MITDGDVAEVVGVMDAVGMVAAVGDVIAGDAVVVDAAADGVANGFAVAVGDTEGDNDEDGDALPRAGVAVGGALVCDAIGFGVIDVAMCAVTDGCADALLGASVAGDAAAA